MRGAATEGASGTRIGGSTGSLDRDEDWRARMGGARIRSQPARESPVGVRVAGKTVYHARFLKHVRVLR